MNNMQDNEIKGPGEPKEEKPVQGNSAPKTGSSVPPKAPSAPQQAPGQNQYQGQAQNQRPDPTPMPNRNQNQYQGQAPNQYQNPNGPYRPQGPQGRPPKKRNGCLIAVIVVFAIIAFLIASNFVGQMVLSNLGVTTNGSQDAAIDFDSPYIAQVNVSGVISAEEETAFTKVSYHHNWTLKKIAELANDSDNQGLILFVDSPGGGVYESDELYFAIKDYQKKTGRPVYSYMASQAASGGYYISAPCDRIYANRNCWTGSIGVTMGTLYDITGLLKKHGVKTVTITSGANKSMGSMTDEMTDEQKDIMQGLVDEAYDQFVDIVKDGRKMDEAKVRKLADGRIYTAKQAKKNGLIDEVGTLEEAANDMRTRFELTNVPVRQIKYESKPSLFDILGEYSAALKKGEAGEELDKLKALMEKNSKFTVTYLAYIDK